MRLVYLLISLVFRVVVHGDMVSLLALLPVWYTYAQLYWVKRDRSSIREDDWEELLNVLPHGLAIKRLASREWEYHNPAIYRVLQATEASRANELLDVLESQIADEAQTQAQAQAQAQVQAQAQPSASSGSLGVPPVGHPGEASSVFSPLLGKSAIASVQLDHATPKKDFDVLKKRIRWKGEQAVLYMVKDVTDFRRVEHLKLANVIKSKILRSLSHELRTPISIILNSLEHCKEKLAGDEESLRNINIALANSNLLLNKYNDLLVR